jgi:tRNA-splicing ligase RtcB
MCAVKTLLEEIDQKTLKKIMSDIRNLIPLGFKHHKQKKDVRLMPASAGVIPGGIVEREFENARDQIGTLGGGNHFIEIQKGSDGFIWLMVHSGSRNIGHTVAEYYNKLAKKLNEERDPKFDKAANLAFFPTASQEAEAYISEMQYCIDFAFANRKLMMHTLEEVFTDVYRGWFRELEFINIAHNYAVKERHFGKEVWIHRKGATSAREGEYGIIPGSQGTKSYIVRGKGNPESFMSCSHGAGRVMGRK